MSQMGQKLKGSDGANAFRSTSESGHSSVQPLAPLSINAANKSDRKWAACAANYATTYRTDFACLSPWQVLVGDVDWGR
jgi:hypothetical protein